MTFPTALPAPRAPDPMAAPALRWAVLGTGWIAERFVGALHRHTRQRVVAVGSRSVASAREFAGRVGVGRAHGAYADLVADPGVDVVHVATPHNHHRRHALLALDAGRHVPVEKPLALSAAEAAEVAARAAERGVFCAEALWTFFLPRYDVVRRLLDDGVLGDVRTVLADRGEWFPDTHRILRHELAGGALLDLGTYPGALAGARATLVLDRPFFAPGDLVLTVVGRAADPAAALHRRESAVGHAALYVSAVEAARRIAAGETGTPLRPLRDSVATLAVIDGIRRQIGVTFLEEAAPGVPG